MMRVPTRTGLAMVGKDFGTSTDSPAADAAAWSLVGLLFFCIACFIFAGLFLKKQRPKPGPPRKTLSTTDKDSREDTAPWQKPDDWWKR